jgi:hypothetical protein
MNKKLMFAIPIMAAVLTIGTGAGVIYAKSAEPGNLSPVSKYTAAAESNPSDSQTAFAYCGGFGGMMGQGAGLVTNQMANLLGTTVTDLRTQLNSGKTLADIATAKGVSQDQVVQTIMAPFKDQMSLILKNDYITQDRIDSMTQQMQARVQTMITTKLNSTDENGWGFMQNMMEGFKGNMMGGWGNYQVQPGATTTPQGPGATPVPSTRFGGMMGRW